MSLTNDQITAKNFKKFYESILPYLNGAAHASFTPVGSIIAIMGNEAPQNFLACDGTAYNIADYLELATYFNQQFGSTNYFGGDGVTTFAVPDLRGEFLRGTGTNSHADQGSGANVGVHQNATIINKMFWNNVNGQLQQTYYHNDGYISSSSLFNADSHVNDSTHLGDRNRQVDKSVCSEVTRSSILNDCYSTTRPTNTSVLYCIATKNIYVDARFDYSTDERVVGTWIDGKPIYQKVVVSNSSLPNNNYFAIPTGIETGVVETLVSLESYCHHPQGHNYRPIPKIQDNTTTLNVTVQFNCDESTLSLFGRSGDSSSYKFSHAILKYTKTTD